MTTARKTLLVTAAMLGLLLGTAGPAAATCGSIGAIAGPAPGFGKSCH
ncbi:hypothetical protein [Kitasatospora sp. NPDC050543]